MKKLLLALALLSSGAWAQNVPNHAIPIGRGPGVVGWGTIACAAYSAITQSSTSTDPICTAMSGNASKVATVTGSLTNGHCLEADAFGNIVDLGAPCGTGSGSVTQVTNSDGSLTFSPNTGNVVGSIASNHNIGIVATKAALAASATTAFPNGVWRTDFSTGLGAPPLLYLPSASACSITGGDGGSQVPSSDSKCWIAQFQTYGRDVREWGADPTGASDSTTAIQSAINSLPSTGGTILLSCGIYSISSTLNVGNGTTSAVSTTSGVVLQGAGARGISIGVFSGYTVLPCVDVKWNGSATNMLSINGPLHGWGLHNLTLDCRSSATVGLRIISASWGDVSNLSVQNCTGYGIYSGTNSLTGYTGVADSSSLLNRYSNIYVLVAATAAAQGITLTGNSTDGTSDTDYNTWDSVYVEMPTSTAGLGFVLASCDSNTLINIKVLIQNSGDTGFLFDYANGASTDFPASNVILGVDVSGSAGTQFNNDGTPASLTTNQNYIFGLIETNGSTAPSLANLAVYGSHQIILSPGGNNAAVSGVTCSGTPTSSFASYNGIVTHC